MVASELCSLHHQYGWSPDRIVSNSLFADGAGAVVLEAGTDDAVSYCGSGSLVLPDTLEEMTWKIGDHGFEMTLSPRVPELIRSHLGLWINEWLYRFGLTLSDISGWALHPGGPRILTACGEALGLSRDQWSVSEAVLAEFGNMSSPTVLFILQRMLAAGTTGPIVMLAFGPGLTIEAALLRVAAPD
jgi:predicted naringenin-chalcone synthase